jgi:hypothetical protein
MLNLIPVVMFLLMQGAGGQEMSLRQQQALLDLAHRVCTAQSLGELESEIASKGKADLAVWIQAFSYAAPLASPAEPEALAIGEEASAALPKDDTATDPGWSDCARSRDGPSAS